MLNNKVKLLILTAMSASALMVGCGEANEKKVEEKKDPVMTMEKLLNKEENILLDKNGDKYLYLTKNEELNLWDESDNEIQIIDNEKIEGYDIAVGDMFGEKIVYKKITQDGETGSKGYNYGTFIGEVDSQGKYAADTSFVSKEGRLEGYFIDGNRLVVAYDSMSDDKNTSVLLYEFGLDYGFELFNTNDYIHNINIANNILAFNTGVKNEETGEIKETNDTYLINIEGVDRTSALTEKHLEIVKDMQNPMVYGEKIYGLRNIENDLIDIIEYDTKTEQTKVILSGKENNISKNSNMYLLGDTLYVSRVGYNKTEFVGSVDLTNENKVEKFEDNLIIRKEFDDSLLIEKITNEDEFNPTTIYEIMKVRHINPVNEEKEVTPTDQKKEEAQK
ncbi:MAG: hypothetical protein ACRCWM_12320 [Sarcina sp.]